MPITSRLWISVVFALLPIVTHAQKRGRQPVIEGPWWDITTTPDLGNMNSTKQQPVDFAVWQAADGSWQLWSCIRGIKSDGYNRLFYRWEAKSITDTNWTAKGIAMQSDTTVGEAKNGLQAPFVLKEGKIYYMFYGDWNNICLAKSEDGKTFSRVINKNHTSSLFTGPMNNTRDPMVLKINGIYYCYYSAHLGKNDVTIPIKSSIFCRKSKDLLTWSDPVVVSSGGSAAKLTDWYGGDSECPFVVNVGGEYVLFRNQRYVRGGMNTQYSSPDPLNFGPESDERQVGQLNIVAPEIVRIKDQYYIVALRPGLNGMRVAKLKFVTL